MKTNTLIVTTKIVVSIATALFIWQLWSLEKEDLTQLVLPNNSGEYIDPHMVKVDGGCFMMGRNSLFDGPRHEVELSDFYIGKYEVTNKELCVFLNEVGSQKVQEKKWILMEHYARLLTISKGVYKPKNGYENAPAMLISWEGANAYCVWLSSKTGRKYDLPTEAQWEYAAAGGAQSQDYTFSGSNKADEVAWYYKNCEGLGDVGRKKPNELGLYDMSGNVYEFCKDFSKVPYELEDEGEVVKDPVYLIEGQFEGSVVCRGGGWGHDTGPLCIVRRSSRPSRASGDCFTGFRLVRIPESQ